MPHPESFSTFSAMALVEGNISLVLHKCSLGWDIPFLSRQLSVKFGVRGTIHILSDNLAIFGTFIGIKESRYPSIRGNQRFTLCGTTYRNPRVL